MQSHYGAGACCSAFWADLLRMYLCVCVNAFFSLSFLLNVPSTWWPLCVKSQMQLKSFFFLLVHIIWCAHCLHGMHRMHGKPWKTCNVSWTLFIVQTHHDNGYRCNFACFMSFIRLFITIFSLIQKTERSNQATRLPTSMHGSRFDGFCAAILIIYTLHSEINDEKLLNISAHRCALTL